MFILQAHDFEAYQEMLREQSGPENAGERYNAISSFLSATEDYLHRLAGKVASVRLAQEASEAAASAMSDARSQVQLDSLLDLCAVPSRIPMMPAEPRWCLPPQHVLAI